MSDPVFAALPVDYSIAKCAGGYNVHGRTFEWGRPHGRLVYECLHLHPHRSAASGCLERARAANSHARPEAT